MQCIEYTESDFVFVVICFLNIVLLPVFIVYVILFETAGSFVSLGSASKLCCFSRCVFAFDTVLLHIFLTCELNFLRNVSSFTNHFYRALALSFFISIY